MQRNMGEATMNYVELMEKRLDNAHEALNWCYHYNSEWGIDYWQKVIAALMRQLNNYMSQKG
jgi:hypothetical protein